MSELCVFAGTTEGRRLAEYLAGQPVKLCACVATEYGETLIPQADNIEVLAGRLDAEAMRRLFEQRRFDAVVDATHPFATAVSENIAAACRDTGTEYLRLNREGGGADGDAVYVDSIQGAADFLSTVQGNALLATGSKELMPYTTVEGYKDRFWPRVLPMPASLDACAAAGFAPAHIIAMQGPFSIDMNVATLKAIDARWLVTKESGKSGGFGEKIEAARRAGARCVVIGQPEQVPGMDLSGVVKWVNERYSLRPAREVAVVGIGMGSPDTLTFEADAALRDAECVIGARRMIEAVARYGKPGFAEIAPAKIAACMADHPEYRRFAVVMSGDSGFYSGTKKLLPLLDGDRVKVVPGLSSMQVLCARVQTSWDDCHALSLHGREGSAAPALKKYGKVFALMDGADAVKRVCADLIAAGMGEARVSVGERLSYPDEKVARGTANELSDYACAPLSAILLEWPAEPMPLPVGLPDEAFIRELGGDGGRAVPMTKSEVRAVSVAKLRLTEDAVVYDVGAGTGSVSVELALNCPKGHVYAIECREDAADLIERNIQKFALRNLTVVRGTAPEALADLPAPTHAFIGGSSGNMAEIVDALTAKNPWVRVVVNAIALESVGELAAIARGFDDGEIVALTLARSRRAGRYHLMTGLNPIYIATLQKGEEGHEDRT
ncbi:MAG: precorrin-6A reductase [Clostridia bacterium]|nr:precorrin-6A reductase [Clostridia bacterium]